MKGPSAEQMKALQHLRKGQLTVSQPVYDFSGMQCTLDAERGYFVRAATGKKLIDSGWVVLKNFTPREGGIYGLSTAGLAQTELFCECKAVDRGGRDANEFTLLSAVDHLTTNPKIDWPKERLLCLTCWRVAPCEGKFFKQLHGANRYVWGIGPICQKHYENSGAK